jgi:hypothetical protein
MEVYNETLVIDKAEVDMLCDECGHEITIGEDYYYDQIREVTLCTNCAED